MGITIAAKRAKAKRVRTATHFVGEALHEVFAKGNALLKSFLSRYKYTIVDGKGNIKGTNRKRFLGIGRLRLDNKKIILGEY